MTPEQLADMNERANRLAQRLAALERLAELVDRIPAGQLVAFGSTLAEHERRLNDLEAR